MGKKISELKLTEYATEVLSKKKISEDVKIPRYVICRDETSHVGGKYRPTEYGVYDNETGKVIEWFWRHDHGNDAERLAREYAKKMNDRSSGISIKESIGDKKTLFEKKIKYTMRNVNGGYSDGAEIVYDPRISPDSFNVIINIYGGGKEKSISVGIPSKLKASNVAVQGSQYFKDIEREINIQMARLCVAFDRKAKSIVERAVQKVNEMHNAKVAPPTNDAPQ